MKTLLKFRADLVEKTLTPAEKKKREEIAQAIERENPNMDMAKKMAIATATAKKVAEGSIDEESWRVETPWMKSKEVVTDKSGAKHTPMSRARDIARQAMQKVMQKKKQG